LRGAGRWFYVGMAVAILVAEFAGFSRSFRERVAGGFVLSPFAELHVVLFAGWIAIFCAQTALIATRHVRVHRRLGVVAAVWATTMVVTGPPLAMDLARRGLPTGTDPLVFLLVMLVDLLVFGAFVVAGVLSRRQPETHKRFMLLAMTSLLPPGIGRWAIAERNPAPVVMVALIVFLAAPLVVDRLSRRRISRVSLWGGILLFASLPVRFAIGQTTMWHHFAQWLTR
jgi:uncharacterized membrane protein YozB (DUF420 family)